MKSLPDLSLSVEEAKRVCGKPMTSGDSGQLSPREVMLSKTDSSFRPSMAKSTQNIEQIRDLRQPITFKEEKKFLTGFGLSFDPSLK